MIPVFFLQQRQVKKANTDPERNSKFDDPMSPSSSSGNSDIDNSTNILTKGSFKVSSVEPIYERMRVAPTRSSTPLIEIGPELRNSFIETKVSSSLDTST